MISNDRIGRVLEDIKVNKSLEEYFFQKLAKTDKPLQWLEILKTRGYFSPENNPKPKLEEKLGGYIVPYWNVLGFLENAAHHIKLSQNTQAAESMIEIVDLIMSYRDENGNRIDNYKTDHVLLRIISQMPIEKVRPDHIKFIKTMLDGRWNITLISHEIVETILPFLIENKAKKLLLKLLIIIIDFKKINQPFNNYVSVLDNYWFEDLLKKYKVAIYEICDIDVYPIIVSTMKRIITEDEKRFNIVQIAAIEDHPQNRTEDNYEIQLVFLLRDLLETIYMKHGVEQIRKIVEILLNEPHEIFKRVAIHTISQNYEHLRDLFWTLKENLVEKLGLKHEIYELLRVNAEKLYESETNKILNWIESENIDFYEREGAEGEQMKAYSRKEFLFLILAVGSQRVTELYNKYDRINPAQPEHPGFSVWIGEVERYPPPDPSKDLASHANANIATKIISGQVDIEIFRRTLYEYSSKFTSDLTPFLGVPRDFQYSLLAGVYDAIKDKKEVIWSEVLNFLEKLVEQESFWESSNTSDITYRDWIVSKIAEIIDIGIKDEINPLDIDLLPAAESILLHLGKMDQSKLDFSGDLLTRVLNSSKGNILKAMIEYLSRYNRLNNAWPLNVKNFFQAVLNGGIEPSVEYFLMLGLNFYRIYSIDSEWVKNNIEAIFPKKEDVLWKAAFSGYLMSSSHVYQEVYDLLTTSNHYLKGLEVDLEDKFSERLVQHIGVAYLSGWEPLDDKSSLMSILLERHDYKQLKTLIWFYSRINKEIYISEKNKILLLWEKIINKLESIEDDAEKHKMFADLSYWMNFINNVEPQTAELIKPSLKYIDVGIGIKFFIDNMLRLVDISPKEIGEIFLRALTDGVYPYHHAEDVQKIVSRLYELNQKEIADKICTLYARKGIFLLKDTYDKYNPQV